MTSDDRAALVEELRDHADYSRKHGNVTLDHFFLDQVVAALSSPAEASEPRLPGPGDVSPAFPGGGTDGAFDPSKAQGDDWLRLVYGLLTHAADADPWIVDKGLVADMRRAVHEGRLALAEATERPAQGDGATDMAKRWLEDAVITNWREGTPTTRLNLERAWKNLTDVLAERAEPDGAREDAMIRGARLPDLRATPLPDTGGAPRSPHGDPVSRAARLRRG